MRVLFEPCDTNNGNNTRTTICNLLRYKGKVKILQKTKKLKEQTFINEDFRRDKAHRGKG